MPYYRYEAFDRQGKKKTGTREASSLQAMRTLLQQEELLPYAISVTNVLDRATGFSFTQLFQKRPDLRMVLIFTKQLATLLHSGIPLLTAIELLTDQFEGTFHRILIGIKDDLASGKTFANALAKYPNVFSTIYIQLVRAGEASGMLEAIITRLHEYIDAQLSLRQRIKKATAYPTFMICFALALIVGMLMFLIPMFIEMFDDLKIKQEGLTRALVAISYFLWQSWQVLLIGLIAIVFGVYLWGRSLRGKRQLDRFLLWFPLTRYFTKINVVVQTSKTLGMLLASGVHLAEALDIVCNIVDNTVLVDTLKRARDKIIKQGKIAYYLEKTGIFPPIASYMIRTGEQSGELAGMLTMVGKDYEAEFIEVIDSIVGKINPLMLMLIGGAVVLMVAGVFLPLFSAMGSIQTLMFQG